jgi:hypothetical protein
MGSWFSIIQETETPHIYNKNIDMKKCNNPQCTTPEALFSKNKNYKDNLHPRCKECVKKSVKVSMEKRKEYYAEQTKKHGKLWREANPEAYSENHRKSNDRLREIGYWKKYYQENKTRLSEYSQTEEVVEKRKARWRERYANDINFKLKELMKANFHLFFKDKGKNKHLSFSKVVGYTYEELRFHLEKNFRNGMDWGNFGELWEIHHVKPQNMFGVEEEQVKECWKLNNLLPLWKTTEISHQMGDNTIGNRNVGKSEIYRPQK